MHRLNALQITAFPEREKTTPKKYKTFLGFALIACLPASFGIEKIYKTSAPLDGCKSVCECVCAKPARKGSKRQRAKNLSRVVSDFIHSRWREKKQWGRWRKTVGKKSSLTRTNTDRLHPSPFNTDQTPATIHLHNSSPLTTPW